MVTKDVPGVRADGGQSGPPDRLDEQGGRAAWAVISYARARIDVMSFATKRSWKLKAEETMDIRGKKFVVIGGAGLIGSHAVDQLTKTDVGEIVIYDNFVRGTHENLAGALRDPRVKIFEAGGDITQTDILDAALKGADGVFQFAALVAAAVPRISANGF